MRKALIIGIDKYPKNPLRGCCADADSMARMLKKHSNGTPNFDVREIKDVSTAGQLRGYIRDCFAGEADVALFYFSGHGYIDEYGGYLVTPDFSQHNYGVTLQEVLEIANQSKCKDKIIILDSCFSGFMGQLSTKGQRVSEIGEGVTILTSSKADETSAEVNGRGLLTSLLEEGLAGAAADVLGNVTPGGLYAYVDKALGPWGQRPVFKTNVTRFTSLRNVEPQVDICIIRKLDEYFKEMDSLHALDPSYEWTNAPEIEHEMLEPYANKEHVAIFKELQKLESIGLVVPVDEDHMYYAAMHSKACKLTPMGQQYWKLAKEGRI